jgi:DNA invertase Pin-like site-specific DNA recombinase
VPRVYSYIRFSDARQAAGASTERQQDYAQRWAAEHGLLLDESLTLRDEGLSAYHQKHVSKGALGVFLRAIEDGRVESGSVLVVEGLDRLSRAEPLLAMAQLTEIVRAGVSVATASDGAVYSLASIKAEPLRLMQSLMVMIRANEESETKSRRVRDALRRQCAGWQAGTYKGLVRFGKTPGWLEVVDGRWQLIERRADAVRLAVDMARRGIGSGAIVKELHRLGMQVSDGQPTSGHLVKLWAQPALVGDKVINLGAETFTLTDYYPAVISRADQADLLDKGKARSRSGARGEVPSIITGLGLTQCGYCGGALKAQTMTHKRRPDGTMLDSHRRIQCVGVNSGAGCVVPGSASVVPVEKALISYCSDLVNLQALYQGDAAAGPRSEAAAARARLAELSQQLGRLTDALMMAAPGTEPATLVRRASELETEQAKVQQRLDTAEAEVAASARADIIGADARWQAVSEGVLALDLASRMQARQLVADTFSRIVVWHHSMRPAHTPAGQIDVLLVAKGGGSRLLRVDRAGGWVALEDAPTLPP